MPRYFFELSYKGTRFAGFQIQDNADTIQFQLESALEVLYRKKISLTGSSRTDAGVHARQNYLHADLDFEIADKHIYNLNAILPADIVLKNIIEVPDTLHSRFHARHRRYQYFIYAQKNPFLYGQAWHFPYALDLSALQDAASVLMNYSDFSAFSKRNPQVFTKLCNIMKSNWRMEGEKLVYEVQGNRFLRGMVRGLVATQLQVGRGRLSIGAFKQIIEGLDPAKADFSAPGHGLFLEEVSYDWQQIPHKVLVNGFRK